MMAGALAAILDHEDKGCTHPKDGGIHLETSWIPDDRELLSCGPCLPSHFISCHHSLSPLTSCAFSAISSLQFSDYTFVSVCARVDVREQMP